MITTAVTVAAAVGVGVIGAQQLLRPRETVAAGDNDDGVWHNGGDGDSPENREAARLLTDIQTRIHGAPFRDQLRVAREVIDEGVPGTPDTYELGVDIVETDIDGMRAEWVLAPGSRTDCRLLYLHGGAFALGSARSHRLLTASLAREAKIAVLAINYRLMPEFNRLDGVEDCQKAYLWMLANGPEGPSPARHTFVAGDSAGGNLALTLIAWLRDEGHRQVDRAIAICPNTDATGESDSLQRNMASDQMLGQGFVGKFVRLPRTLARAAIYASTRRRPDDPVLSPVYGDLSRLPPTLLQASDTEMLLDDSRRWYTKARAHGTDARLELYGGMIHVWHLFAHVLPEGIDATRRIARFIEEGISD
ncbi:MAG: alpha/beta hydrolase [Pseudomonadota bacterium]